MREEPISQSLQRALEASARNDTQEAIDLLQQAQAEAPWSALPSFLIGAELAQAGRIEEAEAAYANAVLLAPDLHIARYELGTLQFTSGRAALALVTWQPLMLLPPTNELRQFAQGYAELAQDRLDAALEWFRRGLDANLSNPALNENIRLVVQAIERAAAPSAPVEAQQDPAGEATHFLLSNYGRDLPLH